MPAYFQMGHDTENLVGETDLHEYQGIILSPVNRSPGDMAGHVKNFKNEEKYDVVFDPQLYLPKSERGHLREYDYFPDDFDSADLTSMSWWDGITTPIAGLAEGLGFSAVASPVVLPKVWSKDYYADFASIAQSLSEKLKGTSARALTTVMASTKELSEPRNVMQIASIMTEPDSDGFYVVFVSDIEPRRELSDETELFGMMSLIKELENTARPVIVGNCSSDMILFKAAGASSCSTGKFFNLRRFTKSRYEEPAVGGGQLPYWFEHSLLAFLREGDVLRLLNEGFAELVSTAHSDNYWGAKILKHFQESPGDPWLAMSWRHYLSWFGKTEAELSTPDTLPLVEQWLKAGEKNWLALEDDDLLFDEMRNDGSWLRPWRQALIKFKKSCG